VAYRLGVDLGTTYTAAAVEIEGRLEMLALGNRALQVPSVLFIKEDGDVLVGEAAERRGVVEPSRVVREFKRRIGDSVPLMVGGAPYSPQALVARLLSWVVGFATERQGGAPSHVTVTHPANWGPFKYELLQQAITLAGLSDVTTCTEPEAAAITYASRTSVAEGERLAVYDLGGGTFDAAVLTRDREGFRLLGSPEGIEHLGGIDFDAAVFHHVLTSLGDKAQGLDDRDEGTIVGVARLRRDCVEAKEALSADVETVIPVVLPGVNSSVRMTRGEFEDMVRPAIGETISAMHRVLASAGTRPEDLSAIVLVGGSSRIPLVSEQLSAAFGRPLALDTHPKHDIALGAAMRGTPAATGPPPTAAAAPATASGASTAAAATVPVATAVATGADRSTAATETLPVPSQTMAGGRGPGLPPVGPEGPTPPGGDGWRRLATRFGSGRTPWLAAGAVAAVVLVVAAVVFVNGNRTQGGQAGSTTSSSRSTAASLTPTSSVTTSPTATPTPTADLPRSAGPLPADVIVWPHAQKDIWKIGAITAAGKELGQLTHSSVSDNFPVLSRDRMTVIYVHYPTKTTTQLRVVAADGSGDRALFRTTPAGCAKLTRPAFDSDRQRLVLPCVDPGTNRTTLTLVSATGRIITPKIDSGDLSDPALTPNGKFVLYWRNDQGNGDGGGIYEAALDGSPKPVRITPPGVVRYNDPAVSPNGDLVAITAVGENAFGIWTIALDRGHVMHRVTTTRGDQDPTWSPDATRIAFKRGGRLWVMNADGSNARPVTTGPDRDTAAAWSPR
jgi:molecular chaperone DnaK